MAVYSNSRFIKTDVDLYNYPALVIQIREPAEFNLRRAVKYQFASYDNLRVLAYKFYGTSLLWWAILDANPQYQTELEIETGDIILIPLLREVLNYV